MGTTQDLPDFPYFDDLIYRDMDDPDAEGFDRCAYRYQHCPWEF